MTNSRSTIKHQTSNLKKKDRAAEAAGTLEWLITAFILAFVFRAFAVEAFRIPTGSMADTLMGAHLHLRCLQCGYEYEHGYIQAQDLPAGRTAPRESQTRCPSCGYYNPLIDSTPISNGDRILVLKWIYQFFEPKRWDVVVFKNPENPTENYIKRLVGLPDEQIEIIDGDIYIDGQIARKPPEVQKELWMPVHDFDFQPVTPKQSGAFNGHPWTPPFNLGESAWKISSDNPTQLVLNSPSGQIQTLTYGAPSANDFRVIHAYNPFFPVFVQQAPQCSDLMVRFSVTPDGPNGLVGITLSKYGVDYKARWDLTGKMAITRVDNGQETVLKETSAINHHPSDILMKFAVVDHQLLFDFGGTELQVDLGRSPTVLTRSDAKPRVDIFGSGSMTLSHIAIFRDTYYTSVDPTTNSPLRASEKSGPFRLGRGEYFMCGDNSPFSKDSRFWERPKSATRGTEPPRAGVVPRSYLVGKAIFVYWPSGFSPFSQSISQNVPGAGIRWIPNVGQMRFIYGGVQTKDTGKRNNGIVE
jgi:signal peptidase I